VDLIIHRKWHQRSAFKVALIILFVSAVVVVVGYQLHTAHVTVPLNELTYTTVTRGVFRPTIPISGTVLSNNTIFVDAIAGGQVEEIRAESGTTVGAGDTLLVLSNTSLLLNVMSNQANLIEQQTNLRNTRLSIERNSLSLMTQLMSIDNELAEARRQLEQQSALHRKGYTSSNDYQAAKDRHDYLVRLRAMTHDQVLRDSIFQAAQLQALTASEEKISENLRLADASLDALVVRAPAAGLLLQLDTRVGESIAPGQRLAQVDASDGFKVVADVDEYYLPTVSTGLTAEMVVAGKAHILSIAKIHPEVDNGRFSIELNFSDSTPTEITRGQTVHLKLFTGAESEALLLERGPFFEQTGGQWAFVMADDGDVAARTSITLGKQNTEVFEVLGGLEVGDRVIVSSYERFGDESILKLEHN